METWLTRIIKNSYRTDIPRTDSGIGGGGDGGNASPGSKYHIWLNPPIRRPRKKRNVYQKIKPETDRRPGEPELAKV